MALHHAGQCIEVACPPMATKFRPRALSFAGSGDRQINILRRTIRACSQKLARGGLISFKLRGPINEGTINEMA